MNKWPARWACVVSGPVSRAGGPGWMNDWPVGPQFVDARAALALPVFSFYGLHVQGFRPTLIVMPTVREISSNTHRRWQSQWHPKDPFDSATLPLRDSGSPRKSALINRKTSPPSTQGAPDQPPVDLCPWRTIGLTTTSSRWPQDQRLVSCGELRDEC